MGNSFRRTRVSWRWLGVGFACSELEDCSGVREMDQASPLRKRTLDAAATAVELLAEVKGPIAFVVCVEIFFPDSRTDGREVSNHWVSHPCFAKTSLATIPRRMSKLVCIPSTCVSARARFAFRTTSSQLGAVMMIFAIKLSKSVPTTVAWEGRRLVSTRTPLPAGNRNELILPTLSAQSLDTSSAVTRSWRE